MKRTTVLLPEDLDHRLRSEASRRGISMAELARDAIEAHLPKRRLSIIGIGEGDPDASRNVDKIFLEGLLRKQAEGTL